MIIQNENKTKRTWKEAPREKISPDDCIISRQNKKVVCTTVKSPLYKAEDKKLNNSYKFISMLNMDKKEIKITNKSYKYKEIKHRES